MANFKGIAKRNFKNNYAKVVSTGMRAGLMRDIKGFVFKEVLETRVTDNKDAASIATLPYSVIRYGYTIWRVAEANGIGLVLKHAAFSFELFIYYNNDNELQEFNEKMIAEDFWTKRKKLKEKQHAITHN